MPVTGFLAWQSAYSAKVGHFRSLVSSGGFSKKPTAKLEILRWERKGEEKRHEWLR